MNTEPCTKIPDYPMPPSSLKTDNADSPAPSIQADSDSQSLLNKRLQRSEARETGPEGSGDRQHTTEKKRSWVGRLIARLGGHGRGGAKITKPHKTGSGFTGYSSASSVAMAGGAARAAGGACGCAAGGCGC